MTDNHDRGADRTAASDRRPYTAPRVLESAQFETLALQCGKNDPDTNPDCLPVTPADS